MIIYPNNYVRCQCGRSMPPGQAEFWGRCNVCVAPTMQRAAEVAARLRERRR